MEGDSSELILGAALTFVQRNSHKLPKKKKKKFRDEITIWNVLVMNKACCPLECHIRSLHDFVTEKNTVCESSSLLCKPQTSCGSFCFSFMLHTVVTLSMRSSLFSPYCNFLKFILLFLKYRWTVNMYIFTSNKLEFPWPYAMAQTVCRLLLISEARIRSQ